MIYQIHKEHGRHIAVNNTEAETNEKNGWKTVSEDEFNAGILAKVASLRGAVQATVNDIERHQEATVGKRPPVKKLKKAE